MNIRVHRSEVLANPSRAAKSVFRLVGSKEFASLLRQPILEQSMSREGQRRLSPAEIDELVEDYRSHRSVYALARIYGVHRNTVAQHQKERGVNLSQKMSPAAIETTTRLYAEGKSSAAIGKQLGFDNHTIIAALRSVNVPIREPVAHKHSIGEAGPTAGR